MEYSLYKSTDFIDIFIHILMYVHLFNHIHVYIPTLEKKISKPYCLHNFFQSPLEYLAWVTGLRILQSNGVTFKIFF